MAASWSGLTHSATSGPSLPTCWTREDQEKKKREEAAEKEAIEAEAVAQREQEKAEKSHSWEEKSLGDH